MADSRGRGQRGHIHQTRQGLGHALHQGWRGHQTVVGKALLGQFGEVLRARNGGRHVWLLYLDNFYVYIYTALNIFMVAYLKYRFHLGSSYENQ